MRCSQAAASAGESGSAAWAPKAARHSSKADFTVRLPPG
jgi:hypothetical protein